MVFDHQGEHGSQSAAIRSIAARITCPGEALKNGVRQSERDRGPRAEPTTDARERIKALDRENRELRRANERLRKASAYFTLAEHSPPPFKRRSPSSTITGRSMESCRSAACCRLDTDHRRSDQCYSFTVDCDQSSATVIVTQ